MFLYKRNYVLYFKTYFCFVIEPLSSEHQYNKYWQSCSNAVFSNSKQRRRIFVDSIFIFNQKSTLKQLGSPTLNRRNSFNVVSTLKQTLINIRQLNFHFQPNFNVETTLMNVDDQRCFKVDSTLMCLLGNELTSNQVMSKASAEISSAISALNLKYYWNINVHENFENISTKCIRVLKNIHSDWKWKFYGLELWYNSFKIRTECVRFL